MIRRQITRSSGKCGLDGINVAQEDIAYACLFLERADLVEALLAAGAGRNLTNDDNETPLDRARKARNRALEKLLQAPPSD